MVTSYDHLIILSVRFRHSFRRLNMVPTTLYHLYATRKWCARPPRKVLEVANAVLGGASTKGASKDAEVTRDDYTSWEGWQRLVQALRQGRRAGGKGSTACVGGGGGGVVVATTKSPCSWRPGPSCCKRRPRGPPPAAPSAPWRTQRLSRQLDAAHARRSRSCTRSWGSPNLPPFKHQKKRKKAHLNATRPPVPDNGTTGRLTTATSRRLPMG